MPTRPNKYGIKTFALVAVKFTYTTNLELYVVLAIEQANHKQGNLYTSSYRLETGL